MFTYTANWDTITGVFLGVTRSDGAFIPPDRNNLDYQAFIAWNAEQQSPISIANQPALTASQIIALARTAAGVVLTNGATPENIGTRAADAYAYTHVNDLAEGTIARLQLICAALNIALPTNAQVAAQVTTNRAGQTIPPGTPDPATVADYSSRRINQTEILTEIQDVIAAGGGDPIQT